MDGDFGLAYTNNNLTLQSSIPNMKSFFKKENQNLSNMAQLFAAASYKFTFSSTMEGMTIEPKLCLRSIKGNSDIIDFGSNITIANGLANVQAIYHSSKNLTLGMGAKYKSLLQINGIYTSGTTALQNESNGTFELNLKLNLMK